MEQYTVCRSNLLRSISHHVAVLTSMADSTGCFSCLYHIISFAELFPFALHLLLILSFRTVDDYDYNHLNFKHHCSCIVLQNVVLN